MAGQEHARAHGHRQPLVGVEGDGVGALDPREHRPQLRHQGRGPAPGRVHVQPEPAPRRPRLRRRSGGIDDAGARRARRGHHQERRAARPRGPRRCAPRSVVRASCAARRPPRTSRTASVPRPHRRAAFRNEWWASRRDVEHRLAAQRQQAPPADLGEGAGEGGREGRVVGLGAAGGERRPRRAPGRSRSGSPSARTRCCSTSAANGLWLQAASCGLKAATSASAAMPIVVGRRVEEAEIARMRRCGPGRCQRPSTAKSSASRGRHGARSRRARARSRIALRTSSAGATAPSPTSAVYPSMASIRRCQSSPPGLGLPTSTSFVFLSCASPVTGRARSSSGPRPRRRGPPRTRRNRPPSGRSGWAGCARATPPAAARSGCRAPARARSGARSGSSTPAS